jgi:hypothetical protein
MLHEEFNSPKPKYTCMFQATILFINFVQKKPMDFTFKVVGVMSTKKTKQQDFQTLQQKVSPIHQVISLVIMNGDQ